MFEFWFIKVFAEFTASLILIIIVLSVATAYYLFTGRYNRPAPFKFREDDLEHLKWIYERMKFVHKENENVDYMLRFRKILQTLDTQVERKK